MIKNVVDPFLQIIFQNTYCSAFTCKLYNHKKHACFKKFTDNLCALVTQYDTLKFRCSD